MPVALTRESLSAHDRQVLESIFDPLELSASLAPAINTDTDGAPLLDDDSAFDGATLQQSRTLEVTAVRLAEEGKLPEALEKFAEALRVAPNRAAVYNNRAQALRLAGRDDEALADLDQAIARSADKQLKTNCHAHCQRGVLWRKRENLEAARADFEAAAALGSKFAKTQLVEINPYSALCNQMLRQAFEQLQ